jgi:type IV pilus assembly protein PilY1
MVIMNKQGNLLLNTVILTVLVVLAQSAAPGISQAQDCEIPLFVKQGLMGANVMIVADNSGSMNAATYHLDYDIDTVYAGSFSTESTYYVSSNVDYLPGDATGIPVTLVDSDNGQDGRYSGNYLNWIYYTATEAQRLGVPQQTRIQVMKVVLDEIIDRSAQLDFGLTVFQYDHGGSIIAKCGTNHVSIRAQIAGITANAWTPLGETMETVLDYFAYDGPDAAIQAPCQYNFILMITDGLPTMDLDVSAYLHDADGDGNDPGDCESIGTPYPNSNDCSDFVDDISYYMAHEDVRPDMVDDQFVYTYVVGFHENGQLLQDTAVNGDGLFFHAENAVELVMSIEYAIQDILRRISAGSAVAVVSTERGVDDRLYRGKFMPIDWDGYMECFELPYETGDTPIWEAGELLKNRDPDNRQIFTALGSTEYDFVTSRSADLYVDMGLASEADADTLIEWARGNDMPGMRDRQGWILGDIIHSTPVVVGAPSGFTGDAAYQSFMENYENREKRIYVGANDGMLHSFNADSGHEEWAFIPEFALTDFSAMADSGYCHVFTCDQTVTVKDLLVNGSWRTILASGGREGGSSVFCLDVTDPDSPDVLWQQVLPDGHDFNSEVQLTSIGGNAVVIVGSGLDEVNAEAWIYSYRVSDGYLYGGEELSSANVARNKTTTPAVVDLNLDGEADLVYAGDMLGSIYRFATNGDPDPRNWDRSEFYSGTHEITAPPVAAFGPNGAVYLYFGTGSYMTDDDMLTVDQQRFIGLYDHHTGETLNYRDLTDQTDSIGEIGTDLGWYVDLWNKEGERVTEKAAVVAETVVFTSSAPTLEACAAGGESWIYQMSYRDGGLAPEQDSEDPADRSNSLGDGIASYPVVDLAQGTVVVQSSDARINVETIQSLYNRLVVRSWQENYDHVYESNYESESGGLILQ